MSQSLQDSLDALRLQLDLVARRQHDLEARFVRVEAALGIAPELSAAPPAVLPVSTPGAGVPPHAGPARFDAPPRFDAPTAPPDASPAPYPLQGPAHGSAAPPYSPLGGPPHSPRPLPAPGARPPAAPFESRVGLHWLNRIGVITLTLGVAFAFKTAVDNDWLSPVARILSGLALALAALVAGDVLRRRGQIVFAQGLTGLGLSLLYLSFWASFGLYRLLPQPVVFGLMVGTTIGSAALSLRYRARAIAILALIGGYITPVVLFTGEPHPLIFFGYLAVLNLGGIALSRRQSWPVIEYLAAAATCVLYAGWCATSGTDGDRPLATVFACVFYAQLAIAPSRVPWLFAQVLAPVALAIWWRDSDAAHLMLLGSAVAGVTVAALRRFREAALWTASWLWLLTWVGAAVRDSQPAPAVALASIAALFAVLFAWSAIVPRRRGVGGADLAL